MQEHASEKETVLLSLGVNVSQGYMSGHQFQDVVGGGASLAFSGYGEFTPITVRSETVIEDADLERHQC